MINTTWICDTCGKPIKDATHGRVEWLQRHGEGTRRLSGLRLVHAPECGPIMEGRQVRCHYDRDLARNQSDSSVGDMPLTTYLGPDGLMNLLTFLFDQEFAQDSEVWEMIKRLHVPGYEHAFRHFQAAIDAGAFTPNSAMGFYTQSDILAVLGWVKSKSGDTSDSSVPICPKCGIAMVRRTALKGTAVGTEFYGCSKFPACKETAPVD